MAAAVAPVAALRAMCTHTHTVRLQIRKTPRSSPMYHSRDSRSRAGLFLLYLGCGWWHMGLSLPK